MKMRYIIALLIVLGLDVISSRVQAQQVPQMGDGLNSQNLWKTPGPSNFSFTQSADILAHRDVSFGVTADYYRKPLGIEIDDRIYWSVSRVTAIDFSFAIGLLDRFQVGVVLPVHIEQAGIGDSPLAPGNINTGIGAAAVGDMRIHAKTMLYQQNYNREIRGAGLALDMGLSLPVGDEENFAGEKGIIWAPSFIMDFRRQWLSAASSIGVRFRSGEKPGLADSTVGNQMAYGLGLTFHILDDKLLLGGETNLLAELDNFERMGMELRGAIGSKPLASKAITVWLTGAAGLANRDEPLLCVPQMRFTLGLSYTPSAEDGQADLFF
ncbi:MAG: hypothetical protein JXR76_26965 [Deltaproteobacteria bacterium]|nr:hypothetical protein [Deltaproteobacteria bacterium]